MADLLSSSCIALSPQFHSNSSPAWLSAVFSAMDSLHAVGGGIATITAVAGQYQLDVRPSAGKE